MDLNGKLIKNYNSVNSISKKLTIWLLLVVLLLTGCATNIEEEQVEEEEWDMEEYFAEVEREEEERLKPICEQEMIPAEYGSECFFRELKYCDSFSGEMIPKDDLGKCMPYFLKEEIESMEY